MGWRGESPVSRKSRIKNTLIRAAAIKFTVARIVFHTPTRAVETEFFNSVGVTDLRLYDSVSLFKLMHYYLWRRVRVLFKFTLPSVFATGAGGYRSLALRANLNIPIRGFVKERPSDYIRLTGRAN